MKREDIIALIEKNRPCIEAVMREADLSAYMNTSFKFEVHLLPDGSAETRERLANNNWWSEDDPSVCEIACYCYQYYDPMDADMDLPHLVNELGKYMEDTEAAAYRHWINEYAEEYEDYPDNYECLAWIKHNTEAYERAYRDYVTELVAETDYSEQLDSLIGDLYDREDMEDS